MQPAPDPVPSSTGTTTSTPDARSGGLPPVARRSFLQGVAAAGTAVLGGFAPRIAPTAEPGRTVRVAVIGLGRGMAHVQTLPAASGCRVAATRGGPRSPWPR
jgi:hypothetical protein